MSNQKFSQYTNGGTPNAGDYVVGYLGSTPGVPGANRRWSFTNAASRIAALLGAVGKVTITQPTTASTLTVADGKTLTASNTLTFTGTDGSSIALGAGGTATYTNVAQAFTAAQGTTLTSLTDAATIPIDLSTSNAFEVQLGGNRTLGVPTGLANAVRAGVINCFQDGTGSRTLAYAWPYQFVGATAPTLSTGKYQFDQLNYILNHYLTSTVTMTIAAPGVITWASHGLKSGYILQLTTTGALPTGLAVNTTYWVNKIDADTFNLSSSLANLQAGTYITTSGSQSGVHTATSISIGITANLAWA